MATINQLTSIASGDITSSDLIPIYSSSNGDARKSSMGNLLTWFKANFTSPAFVTTITVPTNGFTLTTTDNSTNQWQLLRPAGTLASGTVVLPAVANCVDGQEILVTTTQEISSFTVNGNGATAVYGEPSSFTAETSFKLRYNLLTLSWYNVI